MPARSIHNHVPLSFAQLEREVIGRRTRNKVAASRKRGMWMGGFVPMGFVRLKRHKVEAVAYRASADNAVVATFFMSSHKHWLGM